jgi:3-methyladenine DNA glycosylase AlkD
MPRLTIKPIAGVKDDAPKKSASATTPLTVSEIMTQLESFGSEQIKKILLKHGVKEPFYGVKVEHLKTIQKKIKMDYSRAKELFATKNADAMYLAGLIADDAKMTRADLNSWVKLAVSNNISEFTVPWVAAGSQYGFELAMQWIDAKEEYIAAAGWSTLSGLVALKDDADLDIPALKSLLKRVENNIHTEKNRVRHTMNGFIISSGVYVKELTEMAKATAAKVGLVTVDMNGTACKEPDAVTYITKAIDKGQHGKKKKTVKC